MNVCRQQRGLAAKKMRDKGGYKEEGEGERRGRSKGGKGEGEKGGLCISPLHTTFNGQT